VSGAVPGEDIQMWKSLTLTALAGAVVAVAMSPLLADEQFAVTTIVNLPDGQNLGAFDITVVSSSRRATLTRSRLPE